ncbi:pyridoxal phosphate-dependent aminotransferase [Clostridium estertheticum]|uniref:pyridoxal phosphate-dependent aminotransferase n=1 Tax=Clostridium estertheticum TaxID=238834 RepID=UPI001C0E66A7|nr:pyridoxal phosphate-dependent aminotransferase [Clostridium estertheticum]MBU3215493.1 pyridoxal phosphate-dependent aminotransferase [Clostridium estertheticum]WAG56235.1 pyridoxal phosphate-dependent aminotransferase [Clostridium estertheticum]
MIFSKKAEQISPSVTLDITSRAKEMKADGIDVIIFGAGEPDFDTPKNIQNAAIEAIKKGCTKYTKASGIDELKTSICGKFRRDNNLIYNKSQIIISTGAKQCIANVFQSILNPCDEVILSKPYWVSYPELIKLSDGVPVYAAANEENDFKYTSEALNEVLTPKTKAILINSPNNPVGAVYSRDELLIIANFAKANDLIIISDEIYEKFIYDDFKYTSIANLNNGAYNRTIIIHGVSKTYSMTGWRIGYAAANEKIIKLMSNIQSHTTANPNSIAQYAAVEALNGDQTSVKLMVKEFKIRRDYIVKKINTSSTLSCTKPTGAFYIMVNISKMFGKIIDGTKINNSIDFAKVLLNKEKVAVIPGDGFGVSNYVRLSYATSMENIKEGIKRLMDFSQY